MATVLQTTNGQQAIGTNICMPKAGEQQLPYKI